MDRHTIIFTADKRLKELGPLLTGKKVICSWDEYCKKPVGSRSVEYVYVFPTPVNKLEGYPHMQRMLKEDLESQRVRCVFGGIFDEGWQRFLTEHQIPYVDFMKLEEVVEKNAEITAEAVIAELLQLSSYSIYGQRIYIAGFGACARPIAAKLKALGADITIVARNEVTQMKAAEEGYRIGDFKSWGEKIGKATAIINTVPSLVVTEEIIHKLSKETVILDIASKPGGTDFACAVERQITAKLALGLPGIYSTKSSARLYKKAIWENAPLPELKRGEQSWIFQIII